MSQFAKFPVPLTILTGFLGAGKTTVLNRILHGDHGLRIAVLVNDFGAINIDSQLVVGVEGETVSLANGCICCTIRDDLMIETIKLLKRPEPPEYIIVETSGVSDPASVAMTFLIPEIQPYVNVDSIIAVADAEQLFALDGDYSQVAMGQIEMADVVVLNKADCVSPERLAEVKNQIIAFIPDIRILETTYGDVPLELIVGVGQYAPEKLVDRATQDIHIHEEGEHVDGDHHHANHSLVFSTWSWTSDEPLSISAVRRMVDALPNSIYRCKGMLNLSEYPECRMVLQIVGRRAGLLRGDPWGDVQPVSQIVVIASHGSLDIDDLRRRFEACKVGASGEGGGESTFDSREWERADYYEI